MNPPSPQAEATFTYVEEHPNRFLGLFPHRFDYIWAEHPLPGKKVEWRTETRHPLSDRLILEGAYLYGVRFGAETGYCLLDIDTGSFYHPAHDPYAIGRMMEALEPLGLVSAVACSSSYSKGLHLYIPFEEKQCSWKLAAVVSALLETAGFKVVAGQLEVFPNPRAFVRDSIPNLFNGHRLPLQAGSYLLNQDYEPTWSNPDEFVRQWDHAKSRNCISNKKLKQYLKRTRKKSLPVSGKAEKFINDLNAEIEVGWTGSGQTNRLLGRITMRTYIFHHVLSGGKPLEGDALISKVIETAMALPGYEDFCSHRHEIDRRAEEWARCIERSHYFHYGDKGGKYNAPGTTSTDAPNVPAETVPSWNQTQSETAKERIRKAIADLLEKGSLPSRPTDRFHALLDYGIGGGTLYRHKDLWHPSHLIVDNPPDPPAKSGGEQLGSAEGDPNCHTTTSLFLEVGGNSLQDNSSSHLEALSTTNPGSNTPESINLSQSEGIELIKKTLARIKETKAAQAEASRLAWQNKERLQDESANKSIIAKMRAYLASNDPILMAEAIAWAEVNPGVLEDLTGG